MSKMWWTVLLTMGLCQSALAQPKKPPTYKAEPQYIAQLPRYCWAQYVDEAYAGKPGFSIPNSCGAYTNHFCPGFIHLSRGTDVLRTKAQRSESLRMAAEDFDYTLKYITPACPIYSDAEAARTRTETIRKLLR